MHVIRRRGWEIPERLATPEHLFLNRRALLAGSGAAALSLAPNIVLAQRISDLPDPTKDLYPAGRNEKYALDRPITDEKINTNYNNFYEFGSTKTVAKAAQALKLRPWTVKIDGMVETPQEIGIDDLIRKMPLEERLYRHRCVEAWSMAIAWSGFPFAKLVELAKPLSSAKYVRMETFLDPSVAPSQKQSWYPWPYVEGLTIAEATNDKSIVRFNFTDQRPKSYWEALQASEYGFWANVNPQVPHPRWSQATEELIGRNERRPTLMFNGYGEYVADLYKGLEHERLWA